MEYEEFVRENIMQLRKDFIKDNEELFDLYCRQIYENMEGD